jgi:hypothetical protein
MLEGNRPIILMRNSKGNLQYSDDVATSSPIPPCPTLYLKDPQSK